jgi:hypothetical protein
MGMFSGSARWLWIFEQDMNPNYRALSIASWCPPDLVSITMFYHGNVGTSTGKMVVNGFLIYSLVVFVSFILILS